jgi:hypothetical protein
MKEIDRIKYEELMERYSEKAYELSTDDNDIHNYLSYSIIPISMAGKNTIIQHKKHYLTHHYSNISCLKLTKKNHVICLARYIPNILNDKNTKYYVDFHKVGQCKCKEYNNGNICNIEKG